MTPGSRRATPLNQSVERAAKILAFFTPAEPELTLADITARLGTTKPTAHRFAMALREVGLLRYNPRRAVYTLGPRVVELAAAATAGLKVVEIAATHLHALVAEVDETAVLSVWDGDAPVVVHVEDNTTRLVRIVVRNGTRLPPTSAQGQVFAAFGYAEHRMSESDRDAILQSRVAVNSSVVEGIRSVATPVFQEREMVATIALVGTSAAIAADLHAPLTRRLVETAELVSADLGYLRSDRLA
ncbi:MAG: IclR family transcriptional regulator [Nocardioidaceae bacterium]